VAFARTGRRVVLVDGDLQHPAVHRHFNAHHRYGVSDFLRSSIVDPADLLQDTPIDRLRILPAGQTAASGLQLMGSPRTRDLIHRLNAHADLIVIDGPSIIGVSETAMVASFVDATLLVVNAGVTRRPSLEAGRDALTSVGAPIVGTVLNDARGSHATRTWVPPWLGRRDSDRPQVREGRS
jgi:capsular exopolysaccharide synthesis family protein